MPPTPLRRPGRASLAAAILALSTAAPAALGTPPGHASAQVAAMRPVVAALGRAVFFDQDLSLNRNQACASCHDPEWGFSAPDPRVNAAGAVMPGSVPTRAGNRRPPSAAYATQAPVLHYDDEDGTFVGGNFWDGRATGARLGIPAAEQALGPFVNPVEQALPDRACVVYRVAHGRYGALYRLAWGAEAGRIAFPRGTDRLCEREGVTVPLSALDRARVDRAYDDIGRSVAAYEASPAVNRFSSKHDAVRRGWARFTSTEALGLELFNGKAACSACHPSEGDRALFTDYTYDNIGVPANPQNPALLADPGFVDLGVGGVFGLPAEEGKVKVPTLRNTDRRGAPGAAKAFMHNGVFKSLAQVVHFYNTRDILPACELVDAPRFGENCWPRPEVPQNVNTDELGNLGLTPREEAALVAYLRTLNDGWPLSG